MANDTFILHSDTYGDVVYRKICTMSIFTFDAETDEKLSMEFFKAHPKYWFGMLGITKITNGVFVLHLPLADDNSDIKKYCVTEKQLIRWFNKAKKFITWVNEEIPYLKLS